MSAIIDNLRQFLDTGGPVLWLIGIVSALLAAMIIERCWFVMREFPKCSTQRISAWRTREDRRSWFAHRKREAAISRARMELTGTLPLIKTLVALCPLLGLLGTVTGMMSVFDVIAIVGTGNARAMASGISRATIPTMAGMMVALPGLYFSAMLRNQVERRVQQFADRLAVG